MGEDNTNKNNKIASRNIWGLEGSATGDEPLAMLTTKEDKRVPPVDVAAVNKYQAKNKRAKDTTVLVTAGPEIMKRLE